MTETELLEFARALRSRYDGRWRIEGRPIKLIEMYAMSRLAVHEFETRRTAAADAGESCCEEGPWADGHCRHGAGKCHLFKEAENLLWRAENVE